MDTDKKIIISYEEYTSLHESIDNLKGEISKLEAELKNNGYHIATLTPKVFLNELSLCTYNLEYEFLNDEEMEEKYYNAALKRLKVEMSREKSVKDDEKRKEEISYSKALSSNWFTRLFKSYIIKVLLNNR